MNSVLGTRIHTVKAVNIKSKIDKIVYIYRVFGHAKSKS